MKTKSLFLALILVCPLLVSANSTELEWSVNNGSSSGADLTRAIEDSKLVEWTTLVTTFEAQANVYTDLVDTAVMEIRRASRIQNSILLWLVISSLINLVVCAVMFHYIANKVMNHYAEQTLKIMDYKLEQNNKPKKGRVSRNKQVVK